MTVDLTLSFIIVIEIAATVFIVIVVVVVGSMVNVVRRTETENFSFCIQRD